MSCPTNGGAQLTRPANSGESVPSPANGARSNALAARRAGDGDGGAYESLPQPDRFPVRRSKQVRWSPEVHGVRWPDAADILDTRCRFEHRETGRRGEVPWRSAMADRLKIFKSTLRLTCGRIRACAPCRVCFSAPGICALRKRRRRRGPSEVPIRHVCMAIHS
jgi:hypothetical protein